MTMTNKKNTIVTTTVVFALILAVITVYLQFWILDIETAQPGVKTRTAQDKPTLNFGVISRYSPRQIYQGYQPFMDYLSEHTPYHFELRLSQNYQETVEQLINGDVDFASLGNYLYVRANEDYSLNCVAKPFYKDGQPYFAEVIIVQQDSPIQNISDLSGKSFAFASSKSFSYWMTQYIFHQQNFSLDKLSNWENHRYHETVAEKVLKGEFDAGTVKELIALPYLNNGLRVIYKSAPIPGVPLVVSPHVSPEVSEQIKQVLINMKSNIDNGFLDTTGWDEEVANGFAPATDQDYNITREVLKSVKLFSKPIK